MELATRPGMNAHARSSEFPELSLIDDAAPPPAAGAVTRDVASDPETDLASLPTLPRFPAKRPVPSPADAANAAVIAPRMELALEPMDGVKAPPAAAPRAASTASTASTVSTATASKAAPLQEGDTMQRLELSLSEELPPSASAPAPSGSQPPGRAPLNGPTLTPAGAAERFLAEATLEFDAGQIDQPLWTRAVTQANGDEVAARAAYLKARATAIRISRREARHERAERRIRAMGELHGEPRGAVHARGFSDLVTPKRIVAALAAAGVLVAAGAWFALRDTRPEPAVAAAANPASTATAAADSPRSAAPDPAAAAAEQAKAAARELARKVAELSAVGNWNVLVLHASEWTRKAPDNPDAWLALGTGYMRLKQHYEAAEALARASALAPERPETWRALGEAKAAWGATDEALAAYERAVGMDDRDIASLVEMGRLLADKGDLSAAKGALDRALALNAADVEALCAAAGVAQKGGQAKDALAYAQKAKSLGAECPAAVPEAPPTRVVGGKQPPTQGAARR
jgi:cytochrome c-type biogenesis protein CcmH/NrfG